MNTHPASTALGGYYAPRYWPTWILLGSMWLVAQLPYRLQMGLGRLLGQAMARLGHKRRRIAEINLGLCFPELSETERKALLEDHFRSLGMGMVETAMSWWTPAARLQPLAHLEGLKHLQAALARGKGVILLSGHFTSLEIGGHLLSLFTPLHALYRRHKNPLFEATMRRARERNLDKAIPREDMRGMLRSLKDNMPVWYAADQDYGREKSVFAPFFGVPAATITAISRLAKSSGAAVVPFFQRRLRDGSGYRLTLLPALEDFPGASLEEDALRINRLMEEQIRTMPEQYLWVHRRFKTRPEGEAPIYTARPKRGRR
ncbi:MAG: LpxL/LpxP family Kdo(2)-lipid IV(A) lauroyl/palmitoleoyl acyltransferase [Gammaproteobacteria bacterium]